MRQAGGMEREREREREREARSGPKPEVSAVVRPKICGQMSKFFTLILQLSRQPKMLIGRGCCKQPVIVTPS
jgi:hypothetical protein